jgi:hypothetical protein
MNSLRLLLIGVCLLGFASPSLAYRVLINRLDSTQQTIQAEVIVVGRIVEIEDTDTEVTTPPGTSQKTVYKIANLQIQEALVGAKGLTHIRVGFIPINQSPNPQLRGFDDLDWGYLHDTYGINEEGCFFLQKHPQGDFYITLPNGNRLDSKYLSYEGDLGRIKRMIEVFEKPLEALKAKKSDERQFAAWALIMKYRTAPTSNGGVVNEVEIPKEESQLILKALCETENDPDQLTKFANLFSMLRITEKDGWNPANLGGADTNKIMKETFEQWHKTHGEKYCVKKWVNSKK